MDYMVARMQAAGHTTPSPPYNVATAMPPAVPRHPPPAPAPAPAQAADHRPPPVSQRTRGASASLLQRQRREALEQEVSALKQQLSNEETVHHILERALQQPSSLRSSSSSMMSMALITNIIPTKAKELLAELLLVEDEIARLEDQIQRMKQGAGGGSGNSGAAITAMPQQQPPDASSCSISSNTNNNGLQRSPRVSASANAEHCRSMFFISQAMDGEAYLSKAVKKSPGPSPSPRDDDDYYRRRAGMMSSPKNNVVLPPRHSLDKQSYPPSADADGRVRVVVVDKSTNNKPPPPSKIKQHHNHELPITKQSPTTVVVAAAAAAATAAKKSRARDQQPNKLSERILKCLVCIFMRLLRSSRASELVDKQSGNKGGSSFRMDTTGLANNAKEKDKAERGQGQQDHYGIFDVQDAIVRDIGPYKNLVRFTSSSSGSSGGGSSSLDDLLLRRGFSASPLVSKLREMLEALQQVDVRSSSQLNNHNQRLAFWINIYNICIMHGILQHGLPSDSDKLLALKNKATINVSGQTFNALVIENFILRQPSSVKQELWRCEVEVEEQAVREVYGLKTSEPNIVFALCCGIKSSPALRIYKADRVLMDLEKAKLEYLQASLVVTSSTSSSTRPRLMIPSLLHSNMHDFAKDMESLLRWICDQLPTSWSLRKSMLDCLTLTFRSSAASSNSIIISNNNKKLMEEVVDVIPLDYEFQYLLPM